MSLLTIVQGAAASLNLNVPTSVVGNSAKDAVQFLILAKHAGRELARSHNWQNLVVQNTWTTTATAVQTSALPTADYDRLVPDAEVWNRTSNVLVVGPTPSNAWQRLQTGITTGGVSGWWRIVGNVLNILPKPTTGQTYAVEYISKRWCQSSGGTLQETWAADADTALVSEDLIELGLIWRILRARGLDYAEEMSTYEREVEKVSARDRGLGVMIVSRGDGDLPSPFWDGTITAP